jgi:hypothetical protein
MLERHDAASLILDLFLTGARSIEHGVTRECTSTNCGGERVAKAKIETRVFNLTWRVM